MEPSAPINWEAGQAHLRTAGLGKYVNAFEENEYDDPSLWYTLDDDDFKLLNFKGGTKKKWRRMLTQIGLTDPGYPDLIVARGATSNIERSAPRVSVPQGAVPGAPGQPRGVNLGLAGPQLGRPPEQKSNKERTTNELLQDPTVKEFLQRISSGDGGQLTVDLNTLGANQIVARAAGGGSSRRSPGAPQAQQVERTTARGMQSPTSQGRPVLQKPAQPIEWGVDHVCGWLH